MAQERKNTTNGNPQPRSRDSKGRTLSAETTYSTIVAEMVDSKPVKKPKVGRERPDR